MVVQIKGVSQGSAKFLSRTSLGKTTPSDSWYAKLDTTTTDVGKGIVVDSSGNVYVVGTTGTDILILKYNNTSSLVWQRKLSGGASSTEDGRGIAVDNLGNVYIVGTTNNASTTDILIAKYNSSGTLLWQNILAGSITDTGTGIAVDGSGNVYITGHIYNGSSDDIITAKYDTNGNILWQRKLASNEGNSEIAYGITVGSSGNVYIAGMFVVGSQWDIIIAKYNSSGTIQWQRRLAGAGTDIGNGIAVDSSDNVYISGSSNASSNIIIAKYDTNGNISSPNGWQRKLVSGFSGSGIAVDSSGNVYIGGMAWNGSNYDILIAKYNSLGIIQWQRRLASSNNDYGFGIAIDSSGSNVYIAGQTGTNILIARLPGNGSIVNPTYTGKLKLIHSASSLTEEEGGLTPSTPTLTDSAGTLDSFKCDLYSSDPALTSAIVTSEVPVSSTSSLTTTSPISVWTLRTTTAYGQQGNSRIKFDSLGNYYLFSASNSYLLIVKYNSSGTILWQKRLTGFDNNNYIPVEIAIDSSNNVYTCGTYYTGSSYLSTTTKYDSSGNILWLRAFTNVNYASAIAVDSSNNVYVSASDSGGITVIVKYDSSGTIQWQRRLSGSGSTSISSIAFDGSNNVYFCGSTGTYPNVDILIGKYNSSGVIQWQRSLSSPNSGTDVGYGIASDSSGNSYIIGERASDFNIIIARYDTNGNLQWQRLLATSSYQDGGRGIALDSNNNKIYIIGSGSNNILIAKYDTIGNYEWQRSLTLTGRTAFGSGISLNSSGDIYIAGIYVGLDQFNGDEKNAVIAKIPSNGGTAGTYGSFTYTVSSIVASTPTYTSSTSSLTDQASGVTEGTVSPPSSDPGLTSNSPIAVQTLASAGTDVGNDIAVDSSGNYYITGNTGTDILIAKYNSSGTLQWQRILASSGTDVGNGIAVDGSGNVFIASTSNNDIIIAKYNTSGTLQWQSTLASTSGTDLGNAIAVDFSGNVYITGNSFSGLYDDLIIAKYNTSGTLQWQRSIAMNYIGDDSVGQGIAVDSSGNVYVSGYFYQYSGSNRNVIFVTKYNSDGTRVWMSQLDGGSLFNQGPSKGVAVDSSGNVYIAGGSGSSAIIAKYDTNGNISPNGWQRSLATSTDAKAIAVDSSGNAYITSQTGTDIVIAKYNGTTAAIVWQRTLASANVESGFGIAVDSSNNVYITGNTNNDIIIAKIPSDGGTAGTYGSFTYATSSLSGATSTLVSSSKTPLSDSAGTLVADKNAWISTFNPTYGSSLESSNGIALDSTKNIYTIGKTLHTSGTTDSLLVKYNNSGTMQWQRTLTGSNSNDSGNGIAIDFSDNIYTVGTTGSNANDIVISKYNTSGVIQWQAILGTSTAQVGNGIAVDSSGNVYITGSVNNGSNFDALIAKYNSSGTIQWQRTLNLGFSQGDFGYGIAVDSSANVYISGSGAYGSGADTLVAKYNTSGAIQWQHYITSNGSANAIAVDSSGNAFITGQTGTDILIARYHSSGTLEWQRKLASAGTDVGFGIAVDSSGTNLYITGQTATDIIIAKYNTTSAAIVWQCTLTGTSTTDVGTGIKVDGDYVYITGSTSTGTKSLIAKLPNDGSYTGTYGSFTYATSSLSETSPALANGPSSWAAATPTLTSSLILSSTDLNAPSVNNYLR
jgi:uncharacterized delta-60 repeat protein